MTAKKLIAKTFQEIADGLEKGWFEKKPKIVVTGIGSEHGEVNVMKGAVDAAKWVDVFYIGTLENKNVTTIKAENEKDAHEIMERMLDKKEADGAVTMHFPFPIGVSTVGKTVTPGMGKTIYLATTTGTSSTDRIEGMVLNVIYGIICAKACGNPDPTVGILNVEGARQVENALKELAANGYKINFGKSERSDGGCILRGNDVLSGACDIVVADPLTGNILIKMLSSFTTGGGYESVGFGYGPGIGKGQDKLVMIVSRASGSPVIAGAVSYAAELVRGNYRQAAEAEFVSAEKAGLESIVKKYKSKRVEAVSEAKVKMPAREVVTGQISGVEITALEDAVAELWKNGIYAESGMGCTGPIILVSEANLGRANDALIKGGWKA